MSKLIGEVVMLRISGKVVKKKNGVPTKEWITFEEGDIGKIVAVNSRRGSKTKLFSVKLRGGIVELSSHHVSMPEDSDISLPYDVMVRTDPDAEVIDSDFDTSNNPEY